MVTLGFTRKHQEPYRDADPQRFDHKMRKHARLEGLFCLCEDEIIISPFDIMITDQKGKEDHNSNHRRTFFENIV